MRIFRKNYWRDIYYNLIWGFKNLYNYFNIVWGTRPWDFCYSMYFLQKKLKELKKSIENGWEVRESADLKIKDIERCLELIENLIEDDYITKVGGFSEGMKNKTFENENFILLENGNYKLRDLRTEEEKELDHQQILKAIKLETSEWEELWNIISKGKNFDWGAKSWWD